MTQKHIRKFAWISVRQTARAALVAAILAVTTAGAVAQSYKAGMLEITRLWSRATPGGARVGAGYLTITNRGKQSDRLVSVTSSMAKRVSIHSMTMVKGVMRMRPLKDGLEIKPGQTVELRPGGYHLMLMGLRQPLIKGKAFKAALKFQNAGKVIVSFDVAAIGAKAPAGDQEAGRGSGGMMRHDMSGAKK